MERDKWGREIQDPTHGDIEARANGRGHDGGDPQRQPIFNAPLSVVILIAVLALIHLGREFLSDADDRDIIVMFAFIPERLMELGANRLPGGDIAGLSSLFTHAFLHAGWMHLALNAAWLLPFGALVARRSGPLNFVALFLFSAAAGALFFFMVHPHEIGPLIGASGGISGLMGAAFRVIFTASRVPEGMYVLSEAPEVVPRMPLRVACTDRATMLAVFFWLAINLLFGIGLFNMLETGEIAWEAHMGGFLFGFLAYQWFDRGAGTREFYGSES